MTRMRVGSLFSGVGGFDLGLERAGMEIAWQAENESFCNRVLAHHWPDVRRYGDVRNIGLGRTEYHVEGQQDDTQAHQPDDARIPYVDLVCGGFPCQDVSVAGKHAGLDGARSGLWFEFQRILSELRPQWALIENVPGLLSSNQGRDFAVILDGLGECGFGGIAWAVLDSQHFGVAQRRRRVFIVCGPSRRSVEQVLSLCEGCGGNPAPGREAGEDLAGTLAAGAHPSGFNGQDAYANHLALTLLAHHHRMNAGDETLIVHSLRADGFDASEDGTAASIDASVRRLTPTEEERVQGFPDGWTDVGNAADGPRYKALGNAVTVPVIEYIGRRIMAVTL